MALWGIFLRRAAGLGGPEALASKGTAASSSNASYARRCTHSLSACLHPPPPLQVLYKDCYFTSAQAAELVAAFSYGEDKVDAAVKVRAWHSTAAIAS